MRVHNEWPKAAVRNADFITHKRLPGKVLSLEVDVETLPHIGILCVHEDTVFAMAHKIGLPVQSFKTQEKIVAERIELDELREENSKLREVIGILDGIKLKDMGKIEAERELAEAERQKKMSSPHNQKKAAAKVAEKRQAVADA